jgi:hypothetical protein
MNVNAQILPSDIDGKKLPFFREERDGFAVLSFDFFYSVSQNVGYMLKKGVKHCLGLFALKPQLTFLPNLFAKSSLQGYPIRCSLIYLMLSGPPYKGNFKVTRKSSYFIILVHLIIYSREKQSKNSDISPYSFLESSLRPNLKLREWPIEFQF